MMNIQEGFNVGSLPDAVIPSFVGTALASLEQAGYEAYMVGGCVRDLLMGKMPSDWDICTSAKPEEIKACFADCKTIDTGISHGTVIVQTGSMPVEITTYRVDGEYKDGRHPASVNFTGDLAEDLKRRDFTMNAMAYHPKRGLVDPFGGRLAVESKIVAAVGDPEKRFAEDALRIMRGLRFASVLGFEIEKQTFTAMDACAGLLVKISKERISRELARLLLGDFADLILEKCSGILNTAAKGIKPAAVSHLPKELSLRLASVFPEDTEACLRSLSFSRQLVYEGAVLSRLFKNPPPASKADIKKLMSAEGVRIVRLYLAVLGREREAEEILASGACWNLRQLAVTGDDVIAAGIPPGEAVGGMLNRLLMIVIEGRLPNEREALLKYCKMQGKSGEKDCKICRERM